MEAEGKTVVLKIQVVRNAAEVEVGLATVPATPGMEATTMMKIPLETIYQNLATIATRCHPRRSEG